MQPVVAFAGEHCHPSFYSTVHGAYLSGRTAAQFMLNAAAKSKEADDDEEVYNLGAASVADLSTWLQVSPYDKCYFSIFQGIPQRKKFNLLYRVTHLVVA